MADDKPKPNLTLADLFAGKPPGKFTVTFTNDQTGETETLANADYATIEARAMAHMETVRAQARGLMGDFYSRYRVAEAAGRKIGFGTATGRRPSEPEMQTLPVSWKLDAVERHMLEAQGHTIPPESEWNLNDAMLGFTGELRGALKMVRHGRLYGISGKFGDKL